MTSCSVNRDNGTPPDFKVISTASLIRILGTAIANCCSVIQSAKNNLLITLCGPQVLSPVTKHGAIMRGGERDKFGNWRPEEWMDVLEDIGFNRLVIYFT